MTIASWNSCCWVPHDRIAFLWEHLYWKGVLLFVCVIIGCVIIVSAIIEACDICVIRGDSSNASVCRCNGYYCALNECVLWGGIIVVERVMRVYHHLYHRRYRSGPRDLGGVRTPSREWGNQGSGICLTRGRKREERGRVRVRGGTKGGEEVRVRGEEKGRLKREGERRKVCIMMVRRRERK